MNIKRFLLAIVALFVYVYTFEFYVHGMLLANIYNETPNIWRSVDQMMAHMPFNIVIMALITIWVTFIFTRLFKDGGWKNGLCFGLYFGVLSGLQAAGAYYYLPITATLAGCWFLAYVAESLIGGMLIGLIYRPRI